MFNNNKSQKTTVSVAPKPQPRTEPTNNMPTPQQPKAQEKTTIAKDCSVKGEILAKGDVSVFGEVDGTISAKEGMLIIEKSGNVKVNIHAETVKVIGSVVGNIEASKKVTVNERGSVIGDITAPKVILQDGSRFKGSISMTDEKTIEASAKIQMNK